MSWPARPVLPIGEFLPVRRPFVVSCVVLALAAAGTGTALALDRPLPAAPPVSAQPAPAVPEATAAAVPSCAAPRAGHFSCLAQVRTAPSPARVTPFVAASTPAGLGPRELAQAYRLPGTVPGTRRLVAVVAAFDDPTAERDLAVYRRTFGLPACTTRNDCFRKVDQRGGRKLPRADRGWSQEIALDLAMVSAGCPRCRILLVEADDTRSTSLGAAVVTAARLGAVAIGNSYGGTGVSDRTHGRFYDHPGVAVVAATGDSGFGTAYPAASTFTVAVGGTSLRRAPGTARGWVETAWKGSGSGCSRANRALPAASRAGTACRGRAVADVSAVADPATGVAVYGPVAARRSGWMTMGGTSASAPLLAALYARAGSVGRGSGVRANALPYAAARSLNDVVRGRNGSCPTRRWCTAGTGWDGPTGLGTPRGLGAFTRRPATAR